MGSHAWARDSTLASILAAVSTTNILNTTSDGQPHTGARLGRRP